MRIKVTHYLTLMGLPVSHANLLRGVLGSPVLTPEIRNLETGPKRCNGSMRLASASNPRCSRNRPVGH